MLLQSSILRASHLASKQFRATVFRNVLQRRFASTEPPKLVGPMDNAFNRERLAVKQHAAQSADLWRKLCIYVVIPALLIGSLNAKNLWDEHWEHWEHLPPLEERVEYPYMNIRTKAYPWGDGDKVSQIDSGEFAKAQLISLDADFILEPKGKLPPQGLRSRESGRAGWNCIGAKWKSD